MVLAYLQRRSVVAVVVEICRRDDAADAGRGQLLNENDLNGSSASARTVGVRQTAMSVLSNYARRVMRTVYDTSA